MEKPTKKAIGKTTKPVVKVEKVNFWYRADDPILKNVSFEINVGDFFGIVGPNGSGKTTLLQIMLGILEPRSGQIFFWGENPRFAVSSGRIGYLAQRATHFDRNFPATVFEVVLSGLAAKVGKAVRTGKAARNDVLSSLREVGMEKFADRKIGELSTGQQQRVLISRAIVSKPELLFFDEPTLGVDVATEKEFYDLLKYLNEEKKMTLVIVTHDLDIIGHKVNKLMCLHCAVGTPADPKKFLEGEALELAAERGISFLPKDDRGSHHHHEHNHQH
jgi:zinc transport system ATP-binding protein